MPDNEFRVFLVPNSNGVFVGVYPVILSWFRPVRPSNAPRRSSDVIPSPTSWGNEHDKTRVVTDWRLR